MILGNGESSLTGEVRYSPSSIKEEPTGFKGVGGMIESGVGRLL